MALDVDALRARFPALSRPHGDRPLAFFDGPGGTQVPDTVIEAVAGYYRDSNANTGGRFATSAASDAILAEAHDAVGDLLGVDGDEIVFGPNMTTLTFQLSRSIGASLRPGDEVVVTGLDHAANVDPWIAAARDNELIVRTWEPDLADCTLDLAALRRIVGPRTRVVAVGWASNAVGTINRVAEAAAIAHEVGAIAYVDAVHAAPHLPIDARAVDADFVATSVYKYFGPHVGAVYGRRELLDRLPAYKVRPAHHRFETGTANHEGMAGALAAIGYLEDVGRMALAGEGSGRRGRLVAGMEAIREAELALYGRLHEGLVRMAGITIHGITDPERFAWRTPTAAIRVAGVGSAEVAAALGEAGYAVWDGDFYALDLITRLGYADDGGVVRIGLTHYNTADEVDGLLGELARIANRA